MLQADADISRDFKDDRIAPVTQLASCLKVGRAEVSSRETSLLLCGLPAVPRVSWRNAIGWLARPVRVGSCDSLSYSSSFVHWEILCAFCAAQTETG